MKSGNNIMITTNAIKNIIEQNKRNIAFVIGNGIHYQYKDRDLSWKQLLEELSNQYIGRQNIIETGLSLTEFYDIIELNHYRKQVESKIIIPNKFEKIKSSESLRNLDITQYNPIPIITAKGELNLNLILKTGMLDSFKRTHNELKQTSRTFYENNIGDAGEVSDAECISRAIMVLTQKNTNNIIRNEVKKQVSMKFSGKNGYNLKRCINYIHGLNVPILTTNFDTDIEDSVDAKQHIIRGKSGEYKFTDFYPWNVCNCPDENLDSPQDSFSIWHINGIRTYPRSIRLGLCDYMGCVERARKIIQEKSFSDYFFNVTKEEWSGGNTWLSIIFSKKLFIFGLGLEENEVFLRWLLIQRAKFLCLYNNTTVGWYFGNNISEGKRFFLEQVGFEVYELDDYKILYDALKS